MSQERTEQRDPVADMQMAQTAETRAAELWHRMEISERNPMADETNGAKLIRAKLFGDLEIATALRYYIELAERRREERDSNQRLHIKSLEEIDRLNAVITGQAEAIREQTAKVQERDKRIDWLENEVRGYSQMATDYAGRGVKIEERDKEIERLREHEKAWKADHKADIEENSRLRAALIAVKMTGWRDVSKDNMNPYIESNFEAVEIAIEALKGAE